MLFIKNIDTFTKKLWVKKLVCPYLRPFGTEQDGFLQDFDFSLFYDIY